MKERFDWAGCGAGFALSAAWRGGLATKIHLTAARPVPVHHRCSAREAEPVSCPSSSKSLPLAAGCLCARVRKD
jgi:hypothetical protein